MARPYTAAVPGLVGRDQVPRANGIFEAVFNVGWIVGPAIAGLLAGWIGPGPTVAIDAVTFAISAAALLFVRPLRPEARAEPTHIIADMREGIGFVLSHGTLRAVIGLWTTSQIITAGLVPALIFFVTIDRGLGEEVVGIVLSAFAVGALGGSLLAARLAPKAVGRVMLGGEAVMGLTLLTVAAGSVPLMIGASLVAGIASSNVLVAYVSLRTMLSPDALLGRIGATARTVSVGLMPVGSLIVGISLDAVGGNTTLVGMGLALIGAGLLFSLLPAVRRARLAPSTAPATPTA